MSVAVPFSPAFALLVLALPGIWLLGRALAHAISADRAVRTVLPLGLAPALWVLAVHVVSLLGHALHVGLPVGTLLLAAAGVAAEVRRRRHPGAPPEGEPPSRWMWITMALSAAALVPAAVGHSFHDELNFNGHMSFAAESQDGIYPPRHLTFPAFPLRYHYGFDLVVACLTALFRLRVDQAIDAATIGLWLPTWCLLWVLGDRLGGRAAAWLAPALVLLGGNVPLGCGRKASLVAGVVEWCWVGGFPLNAPSISYWFQHPWALATPIGVTAILIYTERRSPSERARLCALGLVLAVLSFAEAALFVAVVPSLVVAEAYYDDRLELRRVGPMLGVAAFAGVSAKLLGGIFVSTPGLATLEFSLRAGFANGPGETLLWNLQSFGARLALGVAGLFVLRRGRVLLGLLLGGSVLVLNVVRYANTNDIVKFAHVAGIAMGLLGAVALGRLLPTWPGVRDHLRDLGRSLAAVTLLVAATAASFAFLFIFAIGHREVPSYHRSLPQTMSAEDAEAIDWLRRRIRPGEIVYRRQPSSLGYAQWGGLPQAWTTANTKAFGFPAEMLAERNKLLTDKPADLEAYRREGFGWFVLDKGDAALSAHAEGWIRDRQARVATEVGGLRIVEVLPAGGG